jgi:hypothetical protein
MQFPTDSPNQGQVERIPGMANRRGGLLGQIEADLLGDRVPLLGHRSITTTVDLYGHLVPEASGRARDALDRAFGSVVHVPPMCPGRS